MFNQHQMFLKNKLAQNIFCYIFRKLHMTATYNPISNYRVLNSTSTNQTIATAFHLKMGYF